MSEAIDKLDAPASSPADRGERPQTRMAKWHNATEDFNATRGFGFIVPDDPSKDMFVHVSAAPDAGFADFVIDHAVTFTAAPGPKGPAASTVAV